VASGCLVSYFLRFLQIDYRPSYLHGLSMLVLSDSDSESSYELSISWISQMLRILSQSSRFFVE